MLDKKIILTAIKNGCPKCGKANIFKHRFTLDVKENCDHCGFPLHEHDSGDGPAVFLIFILGFVLTPLALWLDAVVDIPLWVHAILWTVIALLTCVFTMQPLKAYVIALTYKHRGNTKGV